MIRPLQPSHPPMAPRAEHGPPGISILPDQSPGLQWSHVLHAHAPRGAVYRLIRLVGI